MGTVSVLKPQRVDERRSQGAMTHVWSRPTEGAQWIVPVVCVPGLGLAVSMPFSPWNCNNSPSVDDILFPDGNKTPSSETEWPGHLCCDVLVCSFMVLSSISQVVLCPGHWTGHERATVSRASVLSTPDTSSPAREDVLQCHTGNSSQVTQGCELVWPGLGESQDFPKHMAFAVRLAE